MTQSAFPNSELRYILKDCAEVDEVSKNYASFSAKCGYVFKKLKADFKDYGQICQLKHVKSLIEDSFDEDLGSTSLDEKYTSLVLDLSKKYRLSVTSVINFLNTSNKKASDGCVLILSEKLAKDHTVYDGFFDYHPTSIIKVPKKGLNLDYIKGILPLSHYDQSILKQFQE